MNHSCPCDPLLDTTDGACPCWWRGQDYGARKGAERVADLQRRCEGLNAMYYSEATKHAATLAKLADVKSLCDELMPGAIAWEAYENNAEGPRGLGALGADEHQRTRESWHKRREDLDKP